MANTADPESENGCWLWIGACGKRAGREYPRVNVRVGGKHRSLRPHRVMVELMKGLEPGTLPADIEPDHLCTRTKCINPDHLDPVTKAVNLARRGRRKYEWNDDT